MVLVAIDLRQPLPFRVFSDEHGLNVDFSGAASGGHPPAPAPAARSGAHPRSDTLGSSRRGRHRSGERPRELHRQENHAGIPRRGHHGYLPTDRRRLRHEHRGDRRCEGQTQRQDDRTPLGPGARSDSQDQHPPAGAGSSSPDTVIRVDARQQRVIDERTATRKSRSPNSCERASDEQELRTAEKAEGSEPKTRGREPEAAAGNRLMIRASQREQGAGWRRTFTDRFPSGDSRRRWRRSASNKFYVKVHGWLRFRAGRTFQDRFSCGTIVDNIEQMHRRLRRARSADARGSWSRRESSRSRAPSRRPSGSSGARRTSADAAHGNATPYAFPNSVDVSGTQGAGMRTIS